MLAHRSLVREEELLLADSSPDESGHAFSAADGLILLPYCPLDFLPDSASVVSWSASVVNRVTG